LSSGEPKKRAEQKKAREEGLSGGKPTLNQ